jgi:CRISPR-associated endonuclease/helicase Cas3
MELLAKPTGVTLADHTQHVREEAAGLLQARPFLSRKYAELTGRNLTELLDKTAEWHDAGKQDGWQAACRLDYQEWLRLGRPQRFQGKHLQQSGIRHEMDSLLRLNHAKSKDRGLPICGYAAVAAHHGKLGRKHEKRWQTNPKHLAFWDQFLKKGGQLPPHEADSFDKAVRLRYEYDGPRAVLQLADHRASAKEEGEIVPAFRSFDYQFPHASKRGVQQLITELWDEPFAILRAPTGAGKTDASLLWAQRQIETGRADRLVIAMPTRFTANSLSVAVTTALGDAGLYHSSAWFQAKNSPAEAGRAHWKKELGYARLLETPVTVTTIDHLCMCLTGAREDHHSIFWALTHSCVVIDEADFYDDFTQRNLVVLLRALRVLRVPVLIMSATVPESARDLYALAGQLTPAIREDLTDPNLARLRCQLYKAGPCAVPADIAHLLQRGLAGEPLIIYANTVRRAQAYWDWFQQQGFQDVVLYHSRFTEPHKADVEERLKAMLGVDAWKNGTQRGIAILTQIGELSVNVSADLMISDLCPIDRLTQRIGRLSRFTDRNGEQKQVLGELHLVEPYASNKEGEPEFYPAPYGHYRQGTGWEMTETLEKSREWLAEKAYSARDFMGLVNRLYPKVIKPTTEAAANARKLEESFITNWLIVPYDEIAPDDDTTQAWKSRDIDEQKTVFASVDFSGFIESVDSQYYPSLMAFREWALLKSITIPAYEFNKAMRNGMLEYDKVYVGSDTERIALVKLRYYSPDKGLAFYQVEDKDDFESS